MSVAHHPPEDLLADFAIGRLEEADQLVVAVHVSGCPQCRRFVRAFEHLAGSTLEEAEPAPLEAGAFSAILARITASQASVTPATVAVAPGVEDTFLPDILRGYEIGNRRRVAPGLSLRPIHLRAGGQARAFLLEARPGIRMLEHTHKGTELTCVLKGSFRHEGGSFGPGDFDYGDEDVDHRPIVDSEGPCICLVSMVGDLRLNGLLGRLINPFVRL